MLKKQYEKYYVKYRDKNNFSNDPNWRTMKHFQFPGMLDPTLRSIAINFKRGFIRVTDQKRRSHTK